MSGINLFKNVNLIVALLVATVGASVPMNASAQTNNGSEPAGYKYVEETIYVKRPVTRSKWVEETVFEKQQKKTYQHVWETEQRERRTTVKKPVQRTVMKEKRRVVRKPITETKYRERRVEHTSYETVEEMREQQVTVRKPIIETQYRDEQYTVREKVTEDLIEVQNVTRFKAVQVPETTLVPTEVNTTQVCDVPYLAQRPRLRLLRPGYYSDPATGESVYRRPGLHWVQPPSTVAVPSTTTALIPQTTQRTTYVPETIERRRPVEISKYVDRVETRRVPVEVKKYVEETSTRRVPVTVRKPVTKVTVERVPYTETRYVEEVVLDQVPVTETTYEEITEIEPYDVEVSRWVPKIEEIEVPKTVRKRVEYEEMVEVPQTVCRRVPVDCNGNPIGTGTIVSPNSLGQSTNAERHATGFGSTDDQNTADDEPITARYRGSWQTAPQDESERPKSIMFPETEEPSSANPQTELKSLEKPDSETEAADQAPSLNSETSVRRPGMRTARFSKQDISDIANLEVRQKPTAENEIRVANDSYRLKQTSSFTPSSETSFDIPPARELQLQRK